MSLSDKDLNNPQQLPVAQEKPRWWSGLKSSICKERWFYHFHDSRWPNSTAFSQIFYSQLLVFCHHSFDFISSQLWVIKAVFFIQDYVTGLIASKKIVGWERKFHIQRKRISSCLFAGEINVISQMDWSKPKMTIQKFTRIALWALLQWT